MDENGKQRRKSEQDSETKKERSSKAIPKRDERERYRDDAGSSEGRFHRRYVAVSGSGSKNCFFFRPNRSAVPHE